MMVTINGHNQLPQLIFESLFCGQVKSAARRQIEIAGLVKARDAVAVDV